MMCWKGSVLEEPIEEREVAAAQMRSSKIKAVEIKSFSKMEAVASGVKDIN
jgi:hypothetical protein